MHPRAFYVLVLVLTAVVRAGCDDKIKWYSGLRSILKNCPSESRNKSSGQDELLEIFRRCVQQRVIDTLDALLDDDIISIIDGIDLIRFRSNIENSMQSKGNFLDGLGEDTGWLAVIWNRLTGVLRTHAFKIDVDYIFNTASAINASEPDPNINIVQGRKRRRRRHHFFSFMMMGLLLMSSILVPMGFQFLAVLGGKALLLAKMALILSSIQGLKKIAHSGVGYGLYHAPIDGWHDRSHQVFPEEQERYPAYVPSHS